MKKVIVDFDCAINLKGCDLDDAFALLYLMSSEDVDVKLVTTSFGNSTEENVYNASKKMFSDLNINIPLIKGGINSNDAANEIKNLVNNEDDIIILSLGSTTNTRKALEFGMNPLKLKSFVAMGGITEELKFEGKIMNELNLSIDYMSTNFLFSKVKNLNIITGNNCMKHRFLIDNYYEYKSNYMKYLEESFVRWTGEFFEIYKEKELVLWDAIAALYVTNPEFFIDKSRNIKLGENMKTGFLEKGEDAIINIPYLKDGFNAMKYIINKIESN